MALMREYVAEAGDSNPHRSCNFCPFHGICAFARDKHPGSVADRVFLRNDSFLRPSLNSVLFIRHGFAVSYANESNGNLQVYTVIGRGGSIGETSVLSAGDSDDYCLAATDLVTCSISSYAFLDALRQNPGLLKEVILASSVNTINFGFMSWMHQGKTVRDKIERFISFYYAREAKVSSDSFIIPISHATLALVVGSERATVSKALGRMAENGYLVLRQNAIVVKVTPWADSITAARYLVDAQEKMRTASLII